MQTRQISQCLVLLHKAVSATCKVIIVNIHFLYNNNEIRLICTYYFLCGWTLNARLKEMRNMSNLKMTINFPVYVVSKLRKPVQDSIPYKYYDMFNCLYYFYI